jgi:serine/threonine-protein kinase
VLVDFGITKWLEGAAEQTDQGFIVGTPLYMSPEQAMGWRRLDARADLYGVGAVLFHMLTGSPPFPGDDSHEIVNRHLSEPVPAVALDREEIPIWLRSIVLRCLAKHPDDRYLSALALLQAIRARKPATGPLESDAPTRSLPRARGLRRRWRELVIVTPIAGLVGLGALAGSALRTARADATLVLGNYLARPVAVAVGDTTLTISSGHSARVRVRPGEPLEADWTLVRPIAGTVELGDCGGGKRHPGASGGPDAPDRGRR